MKTNITEKKSRGQCTKKQAQTQIRVTRNDYQTAMKTENNLNKCVCIGKRRVRLHWAPLVVTSLQTV